MKHNDPYSLTASKRNPLFLVIALLLSAFTGGARAEETITSFPWTENFDSYPGSDNGRANNLPIGWHYINTTNSDEHVGFPNIRNEEGYSGQNCLRYDSYVYKDPQDQYAILPPMENLGGKQVTFYAQGFNNATFAVGLMTDPSDASTFVPIATQTPIGGYKEYIYSIPSDATGNYIAIKMEAATSGFVLLSIDDITVTDMPKATDLTVTATTTTTATLSWTESGTATAWQVCLNGDESNLINVSNAGGNQQTKTYMLTGLTVATAYTAKVRAAENGKYSEWSKTVSFNTETTPIASYPWTENFDSYTGRDNGEANNLPIGWHYINTTNSDDYVGFPNVRNKEGYSGQNCLCYDSSVYDDPQDQYAILPPMENLGGKQVTLYAKSNYGDFFTVGVMTNPWDASSFVPIATQTLNGNYKECIFNIPSDATGKYIAIKMEAATSTNVYKGILIDDITVTDMPRATDLTVTATTTTTATLSWTESGTATAWQLCLNGDESNLIDISNAGGNLQTKTYMLTDLTVATAYTAKVRAVGNGKYSEWSKTVSFNTEATPIASYPWTENFDSYTGRDNGEANNLPMGWHYINTSTSSNNLGYPVIYSDYGYSGKNCLRYYSSVYDDPQDQYAILPPMENLGGKQITLYAKSDYGDSFTVGVMTDPWDASSFVPIAKQTLNGNYEECIFNIPSDATGNYIAIKMEAATSNSGYKGILIDDITVSDMLLKVTDLTVTATSPTTATLTWTENGTATAWKICLNNDKDHLIDVTNAPTYTLTGLANATTYTAKVRAEENGCYSEWSDAVEFTTLEENPVPSEVAVSTRPTKATISWKGWGDSYNVRYKQPDNTVFSEGFENGIGNWTTVNCNPNSGVVTTAGKETNSYAYHSGNKGFVFHYSENNNSNNSPQSLISPELTGVTEGMKLEFYYKNYSSSNPEYFKVGYSSSDTNIDSFSWSEEITASNAQWNLYSETIPAGTKYICLQQTNSKRYYLFIDDIRVGYLYDWASNTTTESVLTITGLKTGTTYEYQVQSVLGSNTSEWTENATFTTMEKAPTPTEVAVTTTATTATISWKDNGDSYNVEVIRESPKTLLEEDFENGLGGWTKTDCGPNSVVDEHFPHNGSKAFRFSFSSGTSTPISTPQYLISPELTGVTEGTKLEFWYKNDDFNKAETFHVGTSTTGTAIGDFTFGDEISTNGKVWHHYSETIPADTKYVCLKYTSNKNNLAIDDILITRTPVLQSYSMVETTLTISGLDPGTTYDYRVQSVMDDVPSDWTTTTTFTTVVPVELLLADNATDNGSTISSNNGEVANVTLSGRTLYTDGDWNTLCLPFSLDDLSGTPLSGFAVKELDTEAGSYAHATGLENGTLYLNFKNTTSIEAGKPYIVRKLDTKSSTLRYSDTGGTDGYKSGFGYANLIDGTTYNRWRPYFSVTTPVFCEFKANIPVILTGYTLTSGNLSTEYDPTVWTLQARLHESEPWTVIDSRNANSNSSDALPSARTATKDYTIATDKQTEYKYFHFEVTQNGGGDQICLTNMALHHIESLNYTATKGTNGIYSTLDFANLIDGNTNHRWQTYYPSGTTAYCEFYANMPVQVIGYTLTSGNQLNTFDPKVWALKARLKESDEWTVIDSRNANKNSGDAVNSKRTAPKDYAIAADKQGAYKYFRFEVTENGGAVNMCLSGLELLGTSAGEPKNIVSPTFTDVFIEGDAPTPVTFTGGQFVGTYNPADFAANTTSILFLGAENTLYWPKTDMTFGAFRAYFDLDSNNVREFRLNLAEGEVCGIDGSMVNAQWSILKPEGWYTLDGRKLDGTPTKRGLYIHNGRKVVIK